MRRKHKKTLELIFLRPVCGNVNWNDVVSLLKALGAEVDESRKGSRVGILLNGNVIIQHKPHPSPKMDKGAVESLRNFLIDCGVRQ